MRFVIAFLLLLIFNSKLLAQPITCSSTHEGKFKLSTKNSGITIIKRTIKIQIEENEQMGYNVIFDLNWVNDCTYELRPKKLIRGDVRLMGDGTYIITTHITQITKSRYSAQTTTNFSNAVLDFEIEIDD